MGIVSVNLLAVIVCAVVNMILGPLYVVTAVLLWLGFVATSTLPDYIFASRPPKLYLINTSWVLVSMAIQGAILGAWV